MNPVLSRKFFFKAALCTAFFLSASGVSPQIGSDGPRILPDFSSRAWAQAIPAAGGTKGIQFVCSQLKTAKWMNEAKRDPFLYIEQGMNGVRFKMKPEEAMLKMEHYLVHGFGMKRSLRSIEDDRGRLAMQQAALLSESGFPVAAQLTFYAAYQRGFIPNDVAYYANRHLFAFTAPTDHDADLILAHEHIDESLEMIAQMSPQAKAVAQWAITAHAFDDKVAMKATAAAFCNASPAQQDVALYEKAIANVTGINFNLKNPKLRPRP